MTRKARLHRGLGEEVSPPGGSISLRYPRPGTQHLLEKGPGYCRHPSVPITPEKLGTRGARTPHPGLMQTVGGTARGAASGARPSPLHRHDQRVPRGWGGWGTGEAPHETPVEHTWALPAPRPHGHHPTVCRHRFSHSISVAPASPRPGVETQRLGRSWATPRPPAGEQRRKRACGVTGPQSSVLPRGPQGGAGTHAGVAVHAEDLLQEGREAGEGANAAPEHTARMTEASFPAS